MIKADLIKVISESTKISQKDVGLVLDSFMDTVKKSLSKGDSIQLTGFCSFEVGNRSARQARNFKTKEIMHIPACKTVKIKAGKGLKDSVTTCCSKKTCKK